MIFLGVRYLLLLPTNYLIEILIVYDRHVGVACDFNSCAKSSVLREVVHASVINLSNAAGARASIVSGLRSNYRTYGIRWCMNARTGRRTRRAKCTAIGRAPGGISLIER